MKTGDLLVLCNARGVVVDYVLWIGLFLAASLFAFWVLFWGGADWLEGSFLAAFLVHFRAAAWTADGIKVFVAIGWFGEGVWFVIGLFNRDVRHFFLG